MILSLSLLKHYTDKKTNKKDLTQLLGASCQGPLFNVTGSFHLPAARDDFYNAKSPDSDGWRWSVTPPRLTGRSSSTNPWPCSGYSALQVNTTFDAVDFSFKIRVDFKTTSSLDNLYMFVESDHGQSHVYLEIHRRTGRLST